MCSPSDCVHCCLPLFFCQELTASVQVAFIESTSLTESVRTSNQSLCD